MSGDLGVDKVVFLLLNPGGCMQKVQASQYVAGKA